MKDRIKYLDKLRLFAILNIILLHVIAVFRWKYFTINSTNFFIMTFLDSFTRTGIPIFFMLTGILMLKKEENESYLDYFKKRVVRLIVAYIFFSIIYYLYHIITMNQKLNFFELIRQITSSQTDYHLWFMPVIILIYTLIPFIKILIKNMKKTELKKLIVIIYLLTSGLKTIEIISSLYGYSIMSNFILSNLVGYMNYLFVGYYLANNDYKISKKLIILSILSILCIAPGTLFISRVEINDFFLNAISPFVIAPSFLVFLLFKNNSIKVPEPIEKWIAKNCGNIFYVYLIHILFLNIFQETIPSLFKQNNIGLEFLIIIGLWIVVSFLSFLFAKIWNRLKEQYKKYNNHIKKILVKILSISIVIFFSLVLINLLLNHYHFIKLNYLEVLVGILFWIGMYYLINKYQNIILKNKYFNIALISIFIIIQIMIGFSFMVTPSWDFGEVYNIAVSFAKASHPIFGAPYLYMCDNNIIFTVIFDIIFKLLYILGLKSHFIELGIIINIIMIDVSIFYTYLFIRKINKEKSKIFLIFILCSSPLLFYIPIFYTDTISMPFVIVSLYYSYRYIYETKKIKDVIISALTLGIGSLIKPTVLIVGIAILILLYLKKKKINYYQFISIFIVLILIPALGKRVFINQFFEKESIKQYRIPMSHYILIGLENNGEFNTKRYLELNQDNSQQERQERIRKSINKRINTMKKNHEVLSFYNRKIAYTWTDGTFYSFEKLRREPIHNNLTKYVYSDDNKDILYWTFSNSEWIIILVLMIFGIVFKKYLPDRIQELGIILNISTIGMILFLLIWETRSRYLVNFIPVFMINAYIGMNAVSYYIKSKKEGKE